MRLILQFCLLLLVLLGAKTHAWGKVDVGQNIASGGPPLFLVDCTDGDAPPALITPGEPGPWDYEPAPDVCNGPNLYAYVKQNPWTSFDPLGLSTRALNFFRKLGKLNRVMEKGKDGAMIVGGRKVIMPKGIKPGDTYHFSGKLKEKYPAGVPFDGDGFPDFSKYERLGPGGKSARQTIEMTGDNKIDFKRADAQAGISEQWRNDNGLTWHHHQDGQTMMLVDKTLNGSVSHTGGAAIVRAAERVASFEGYMASIMVPASFKAFQAGSNASKHDKIRAPIVDSDPSGLLGGIWPDDDGQAEMDENLRRGARVREAVKANKEYQRSFGSDNFSDFHKMLPEDWNGAFGPVDY